MERKKVKSDVLCIGGGPAGLMAAIRAAELGASVVVLDKSNTLSGGCSGGGNDHFTCYIPEFHGNDVKPIIEEYIKRPVVFGRIDFRNVWLERSFEVVKLWDRWGIPMKYKGKWEFAGHTFPGFPCIHLKYSGGNQKPVLTEQALKRGVKILNRVTGFELLKNDGRIVGALGLDTWKKRLIECEAKAVFLGTGRVPRLFPSATAGWMFNTPDCPFVTGDGRAMVYRIGAELADMELIWIHAGPKYFARAGRATWIGVLRTPDDKPVGPFITKPDKQYGDITMTVYSEVFNEYMKTGKGPVYMDCRGASAEDMEYMLYWLRNEGNTGLLNYMSEKGIDPAKHPVEFSTYSPSILGGVWFNVRGETSMKGLFSGGDEYSRGMSGAVVWGWVAGETMAKYIKEAEFSNFNIQKEKIAEQAALLDGILAKEDGATWEEANIAIQQIMMDYSGLVRSQSLLEQGMTNLKRLREDIPGNLVAKNGHELGRCLEVMNLLDVGEAVMLAANERKETRFAHRRFDYPFFNPQFDKFLVLKKEGNKPVFKWVPRTK